MSTVSRSQRPVRRSIIAVACGLLAMIVPAQALAAPTTKVKAVILAPRAAHVVSTPEGRRLVVSVPVRYELTVEGASTARTRMRMRLAGQVELPGGHSMPMKPDARRYPGASDRTVDHALFLSAAQTTKVIAARSRPGTSGPGGSGEPTMVLKASVVAEPEGGPARSAEAESSAPLPAPTPLGVEEPVPGEELGHARGNDPCGYYGLKGCEDVSGPTWKAEYFLDRTTPTMSCPNPAFPYPTDLVTDETTSSDYHQSVEDYNHTAEIEIMDYNTHGHPVTYHPWLACTEEDHESEPTPPTLGATAQMADGDKGVGG